MFPEYLEKYNQQQQQLLSEQAEAEVSAGAAPERDLMLRKSERLGRNGAQDGLNKVDPPGDRRNNKNQPFPTWMLLLLVSIFGVVMALPLLQL